MINAFGAFVSFLNILMAWGNPQLMVAWSAAFCFALAGAIRDYK